MKLGYAVVVPSDQKFYLPIDMSEQTVSIEAAFRDKTKILILKGNGLRYRLYNPNLRTIPIKGKSPYKDNPHLQTMILYRASL